MADPAWGIDRDITADVRRRLIAVAARKIASFRWPEAGLPPEPEGFVNDAVLAYARAVESGAKIRNPEAYCAGVIAGPHGLVYTAWRSEQRRVRGARFKSVDDGGVSIPGVEDPSLEVALAEELDAARLLLKNAAALAGVARWPEQVRSGFLLYAELRLSGTSGPQAYDEARRRFGVLPSRTTFDNAFQIVRRAIDALRSPPARHADAGVLPRRGRP